MNNYLDDITSFQTGVDTIASGCTTYGSTPTAKTPTAIVNAIKTIYTNRYNAGVTATKKGTATTAQVLTGYTFTNASSVGASGTMTNRGAWTNTATGSGKVTIPAGYHNGSGYVNTATCYTNGYNAGVTAGSNNINVIARGTSGGTINIANGVYYIVICSLCYGANPTINCSNITETLYNIKTGRSNESVSKALCAKINITNGTCTITISIASQGWSDSSWTSFYVIFR